MQLRFERFDGRSRNDVDVIDQDTGAKVGLIHCGGSGREHGFYTGGSRTVRIGGIHVSLFGGKYAASLNSYEECAGFIQGVEAVLNRMILVLPGESQSNAA
jgi:hypothetical protein